MLTHAEYTELVRIRRDIVSKNRCRQMRKSRKPPLPVPPKPKKPPAYQAIDIETNLYIGTIIGTKEHAIEELKNQGITSFRLEKIDPIIW